MHIRANLDTYLNTQCDKTAVCRVACRASCYPFTHHAIHTWRLVKYSVPRMTRYCCRMPRTKPCQYVKKTTILMHANLGNGFHLASSCRGNGRTLVDIPRDKISQCLVHVLVECKEAVQGHHLRDVGHHSYVNVRLSPRKSLVSTIHLCATVTQRHNVCVRYTPQKNM